MSGDAVEYGGESLRFLWEDVVMMVQALLPVGNKAGNWWSRSRDCSRRCGVNTRPRMLQV